MEKFHEMKIPPTTPIVSHFHSPFLLTLLYHKSTLSLWTLLFWTHFSAESYNHMTRQFLFLLLLEVSSQWLLDCEELWEMDE